MQKENLNSFINISERNNIEDNLKNSNHNYINKLNNLINEIS